MWDEYDRALHLATDRFRIQPAPRRLLAPDQFLFGSRMGTLLASPAPFEPTVDAAALLDVVASSVVAAPRTVFREVDKLPAAHRLTLRGATASVEAMGSTRGEGRRSTGPVEERLAEETRVALGAAVEDRLRADAPGRFGAFLSGGSRQHDGRGSSRSGATLPSPPSRSASPRSASTSCTTPGSRRAPSGRIHGILGHAARHRAGDGRPRRITSTKPVRTPRRCRRISAPRSPASTGSKRSTPGTPATNSDKRYADGQVFEPYERVPRWIRDPLTPVIAASGRRSSGSGSS